MKRYNRGERLEQSKRLKKARKGYWNSDSDKKTDVQLGMLTHTPTICSCHMCGNPRKYYGNSNRALTIREISDREFARLN